MHTLSGLKVTYGITNIANTLMKKKSEKLFVYLSCVQFFWRLKDMEYTCSIELDL